MEPLFSFPPPSYPYYIINDANKVVSYEKLKASGDRGGGRDEDANGLNEWLTNELPENLCMTAEMAYTDSHQFSVWLIKSGLPDALIDPVATLKIPYTFTLKQTITKTIGAFQVSQLIYKRDDHATIVENPYLRMVAEILLNGQKRDDRTGTGTVSIFGAQMRFNIREKVPLLTTKQVPWKSCLHELLWFLRGSTDSRELEQKKVSIWRGNTRRAFLDQRGLTDLPEGDIGAGYGFQWRHFGGEYRTCESDYRGEGIDQIAEVIRLLKEEPYSRRIVLSAWNPSALSKMALPPCHILCQFYVSQPTTPTNDPFCDKRPWLSCHMYQRSQDVFLGAPFNIFSYTALTYLLATICDMRPCELIISTGDTHIYTDHLNAMKEQSMRVPLVAPKLTVSPSVKHKKIEDICIEDFTLEGYFYHPKLVGAMSV